MLLSTLLLLTACQTEETVAVTPPAAPVARTVSADPDAVVIAVEEDISFSIQNILSQPERWSGKKVVGTVTVPSVPTDRGFWIESSKGERMFALLIDGAEEDPLDINAGQELRISKAVVYTDAEGIPGKPLTAESKRILADQPAFLVIDEVNIDVLATR